MTKQLYLQDSSLTEFDAIIIEVIKKDITDETKDKINDEAQNVVLIVLDQTAFYPEGGGQPCDTGMLTTNNGVVYQVVFVGTFNGKIIHKVDTHNLNMYALNQGLKVGNKVHGKIDFERRQILQRMHTACHVLSSVFVKKSGALITGNQLNTGQSRIDFSLERFDREKIQEYINKANELLATNQDVETFFLPRHQAEKMPELAKLAMGLKEGINEIRVVKIGEIDTQADGGTHVKNTLEVGEIELVKCENKGKNSRRLYFRLKEKGV